MCEAQMVMTIEQWTDTADKWYMDQFAEIDQLLREGKEKAAADNISLMFGNSGK